MVLSRSRKVVLLAVAALILSACSSGGGDAAAPSAGSQGGGAITVAFQNDIGTLDPAIGYDWQNWSIIKSLFNGLMSYSPGTTDLVLSLIHISEPTRPY